VSYSRYYVNTAGLYNLTSGDNTRSLRKMFSVSLPVLLCRVCSCFISVFSSVISVHSLSVCLLYFMLAALVANKRRPIRTSRARGFA